MQVSRLCFPTGRSFAFADFFKLVEIPDNGRQRPAHTRGVAQRGGGTRMIAARQERMGPQAIGWRDLSRQISTAVRKFRPQLMTTLFGESDGLTCVKRETISSGGIAIWELRLES